VTDIGSVRAQTKVSGLGLTALGLALVGFPVFKVQVIEHLSSVVRYGETHAGPGRYVWAATYIGAEFIIAALCLASVYREGRRPSDVGLSFQVSRSWWVLLVLTLLIASTVISLRHFDVLEIMGRPGQDYGALAATTTWQRVEGVVMSAVVVPIEELIWRGFAITRLERLGAPTWLAVLLPSLAFGYFHGGTVDTLAISAVVTLGVILLSVVYVRRRSLSWPILLHFGWNVVLLSLTPMPT
jgi:membrane protease YdiL (CAAX protease family)